MIKYKLKEKYKKALICFFGIACGTALIYVCFIIYQARYKQTNGARPGSVRIEEIFKK